MLKISSSFLALFLTRAPLYKLCDLLINAGFLGFVLFFVADFLAFFQLVKPGFWKASTTIANNAWIPFVLASGMNYSRLRYTWPFLVVKKLFRFLHRTVNNKPQRAKYLWGILFSYFAYTHLSVVIGRHQALYTRMDLGIYANACKNFLWSSVKGDIFLMADHFEPLLFVFSPICAFFDPAISLLTLQILGLIVGGIGVGALLKTLKWSFPMRFLFVFAFLSFSPQIHALYYDFHLIAFSISILPWMFYFYFRERWIPFILLCLLYLGLKESAALTIASLSIFVIIEAFHKKNPRQCMVGFSTFLVSVVFFIFVMEFVYPHFLGGHDSVYFKKYYSYLGANMKDVFVTIFTKPIYFLNAAFSLEKLKYVFSLMLPFLLIHLIQPKYLLIIVPPLAINLLSEKPELFSRNYHYDIEINCILWITFFILLSRKEFQKSWPSFQKYWNHRWSRVRSFNLVSRFRPFALFVCCFCFSDFNRGFMTQELRLQKKEVDYIHLIRSKIPQNESIVTNQILVSQLTEFPKLYMIDYPGHEDDWRKANYAVLFFPRDISVFQQMETKKTFPPIFDREFERIYEDPKEYLIIWKRKKT